MQIVRIVVLFIFGLFAVFAFLQRQLMYPAMRASSLAVKLFPQLEETFHHAADVELTTDDQIRIKGWYLRSQSTVSDRLILLFHGNGGHRAHRKDWYLIAKSIEADVLAVDYHGYGDSSGKPSETALMADADAAWRFAVEELKYRPSQVVIVGESLGGGVGVQLAARLCRKNEAPAGLVLSATFSSMVDAASRKFWWLPVRLLLLDRYRSDRHIGDVTCPLLQFHGDRDTLIPLEMGEKLHQLAPEKSSDGRARQLVVLKEAGHNNLLQLHSAAIREHMNVFIR